MNPIENSLVMDEAGVMFAVGNQKLPTVLETEWRIPQELENLDVVPFYHDLRQLPHSPREGKLHVCHICGFTVERKFHLNSHMNTHGFHLCKICDFQCRTLGNINKHMRKQHTVEERLRAGMQLDPLAGTVSMGVAPLQDSSILGSSQKSCAKKWKAPRKSVFPCRKCEHQSTSKEDSWIHMRTHIPLDQQKNCGQCGFVTVHKHHLDYHVRNHFGSKPFCCEKCAYSSATLSSLRSHMRSHDSNYPFICTDCGYSTKYSGTLKAHLKKHHQPGSLSPSSSNSPDEEMSIHAQLTKILQEAPQDKIASAIEAALSQSQTSQQNQILPQAQSIHRLIHEDVKEFCPHCDTPFNNLKLFEAHMDLHTPGDPFKCSKCQFGAGNGLGFALHVFLSHP